MNPHHQIGRIAGWTRALGPGLLLFGLAMMPGPATAQTIFVKFSTSTGVSNQTATINPAFGYPYSGAAPVTGTVWNVLGRAALVPQNTTPGSDYTLWSNLPLTNSLGGPSAQFLTILYHSTVTTGTRSEPSTANGENVIQPGGVMQNAWRNFFNASGNYFTFIVSNLPASTPYAIYIHGGTTGAGQGAGITLDAGYGLAGSPTNGATTNTVLNSNGALGSLWTTNTASGGFKLMNEKETWLALYAQSDASGKISFRLNGAGSAAYLNGFQITPLAAPGLTGPTNLTVVAGNDATLTGSATGLPAPRLQWLENGTNIVGATNSSLTLLNVQYAQNGFAYSLLASNLIGSVTNTMTLTVIVPPSISDLTNQAAAVGTDITIAPNVSGVPTPALQWQKDGSNLTGQTSATLSIPDAQSGDSGQYCLIASNAAGVVTNCMTLTIGSDVAPTITGLTDQTVVQGNTGTFAASVSGVPVPTLQWRENGSDIPGATGSSLILTNVQFAQNGYTYSLVASNNAGVTVSNATLYVLVPVSITVQPQNVVVTNTQSASFSVTASGVPAPAYQWTKDGSPIANATNATFSIASAAPADMGTYAVVVSNVVNSVTSSNATLIVNSTMSVVSLTPSHTAAGVCYDTPLYITFDRTPLTSSAGAIKIYSVTNSVNPVDIIVAAGGVPQPRTIGGESFNTYSIFITSNTAAIYPHLGVLTSNQTYYVTVEPGTFTDTNGALFAGITSTNAWRFSTKPTGPADPNNIIVDAAGNGDFCTVQGAVDFVATGNTVKRLVNIRNGNYIEVVNVRSKHNLTFRGQSRSGAKIIYPNNANINPSSHMCMVFKINGNDITLESLTLTNSTPQGGGQAFALMGETAAKRIVVYNADICSYQDTILMNTSDTTAYFQDCLIKGDVDYIWGGGNCYFQNCELRFERSGSVLTQTRTSAGVNGMAFHHCQVTRASTNFTGSTLGRSLSNPDGNAFFIYCLMDSNGLSAAGWTDNNTRYWTYENSNLTATAKLSFTLGTELTNGDYYVGCAQSPTCWLNGWTPQLAPNILSGPTNLTVTPGQSAAFNVNATGIPAPSYQWRKAGTNLVGQTGATLSIPVVDAGDAGTYSVIVSNNAGSVTNSATLTVVLTPFQSWQNQYFGCTLCPPAAAGADPDGDGLDNNAEFLAGTGPTNNASALQIIAVRPQGNDMVITWNTGGGKTNAVQAAELTNFTDISAPIIIPGTGDATTNFADAGGATNAPTRYYRVRLVP